MPSMGMRFRKSISIGKGARINFSKSGASLSLGPRGASVSLGKRGTFLNLGIPGTGLSMRTRIDGNQRATGSRSSGVSASRAMSPERQQALLVLQRHVNKDGSLPLKAGLNDQGEIIFVFTDTGEEITDKAVIREIKKLPEIKNAIATLQEDQRKVWSQIQSESEEASKEFIEIYKLTPKVMPVEAFAERFSSIEPHSYARQTFPRQQPSREDIANALKVEAEKAVTGLFKKKKIEEYVSENYSSFAPSYINEWQNELAAFEAEQDRLEQSSNEQFQNEKAAAQRALSDNGDTIIELVEDWLMDLSIPADVSAQIDYADGLLNIDLDLPKIEDLPSTTTKQLKSGQVKVVDKTQKQLKQEYASCVLGLSFFLAANIFNLNSAISEIWVSGYTQRRNSDGDMNDDYIYSVKFPRSQFQNTQVEDPFTAFNEFENRMKLSAAFAFGTIKPYEPINR